MTDTNDKEVMDEQRLIKLYTEITGESDAAARSVLMYALDEHGKRNGDIPRYSSLETPNGSDPGAADSNGG